MAQKSYVSLNRLSDFLDNLKNKFAAISHKHTIADIADYIVDYALSDTSVNPIQNKAVNEEFEAIATAMNVLEQTIDGKADSVHTHSVEDIASLQDLLDEINTKILFLATISPPIVTSADNGKILQVVDGKWTAVAITNGNEVAY